MRLDGASSISAAGGGGIADDVSVRVDARVGPSPEADVFLVSPAGTRVQLVSGGAVVADQVFDDAAPGAGPVDPVVRPAAGFLASFVATDLGSPLRAPAPPAGRAAGSTRSRSRRARPTPWSR